MSVTAADGATQLPTAVRPIFFFNDPATTEIYTLSLHDALPISDEAGAGAELYRRATARRHPGRRAVARRSEEHTSELQSPCKLVCRLLLEKKKTPNFSIAYYPYSALCGLLFKWTHLKSRSPPAL